MTTDVADTAPELAHADIAKVFSTIDMPSCPAILTRVLEESQKDDPDLVTLAQWMGEDVGMSATAIKLANSPLFRGGARVANVRKAVERLGIRNVVCVVVTAALRASIAGLPPQWLDRFWNRSASHAMAAGMIGRRQYGVSADAAYTYALFHDAGIPLLLRRFPDYEQVLAQCIRMGQLAIDAERDYFPCTHPIVGSLLVRNWGLPASLVQAVRFHHDPDVYDLPDRTLPGTSVSLIAATHVAEHLVSEMAGERDYEVGDVLFERALGHFGISEHDLDQLREDLAGTIDAGKA